MLIYRVPVEIPLNPVVIMVVSGVRIKHSYVVEMAVASDDGILVESCDTAVTVFRRFGSVTALTEIAEI